MIHPNGSRRFAGLLAAFFFLTLAVPAFAHRVEKRFSVELRPVVTVRNKSGKVTVKSWDKPEVVVVANHVSDKIEVDADQIGNRVEAVTHHLSENVKPEELKADYEITVPRETHLQIKNDLGDVFVEQLNGELTFETVAAGVNLQEVSGYLMVNTVDGSLVCIRCAGRIEMTSVSGSFTLRQPVASFVRAKTITGNIFYDGAFERDGSYSLNSSYGTIEVRFSDTDNFVLNATSVRGQVINEAELKPPAHSRPAIPSSVPHARSFGTFNQGFARVDLYSFSGTIKVLKRDF